MSGARSWLLVVVSWLAVFSAGCSPDEGGPDAAADPALAQAEADGRDGSDPAETASTAEETDAADSSPSTADSSTSVTSPPELEVALPDEEPAEVGSEVIELGSGPEVASGDLVFMSWEMVAFDTAEVVESTANDYGGPIDVLIGGGNVPAALDQAVIGQPIGSRLAVQFPVGMADLPPQFDAEQAYVLMVELVELAEQTEDGASAATTTTPARPTTTDPKGRSGTFVPVSGPLSVQPPIGATLPSQNWFDVVGAGDGPTLAEGDQVQLAYVMVSWTTGETVLSTDDEFGGPQSIVLGDQAVPRYLEHAVFGQPVGSRLQVVYSPDLPDLPTGLSTTDAYIVAVDIIGRG